MKKWASVASSILAGALLVGSLASCRQQSPEAETRSKLTPEGALLAAQMDRESSVSGRGVTLMDNDGAEMLLAEGVKFQSLPFKWEKPLVEDLMGRLDVMGPFDETMPEQELLYRFILSEEASLLISSQYLLNSEWEEIHSAKGDPHKLFYNANWDSLYFYRKYDGAKVDWILRNIFNREPSHTTEVYPDPVNSGRYMYYHDGYYYGPGNVGIGFLPPQPLELKVVKDYGNNKFQVKYRYRVAYDGSESVTNAVVQYKTIDGKGYWSFYKVY